MFSGESYSCSPVTNTCLTLWPHELQHTRPPCAPLSPRACSSSCPLSWWCHPTITYSVAPFFSCPPSFPTSGSFPVSQLFESSGQSTMLLGAEIWVQGTLCVLNSPILEPRFCLWTFHYYRGIISTFPLQQGWVDFLFVCFSSVTKRPLSGAMS